MSDSSVVIVGAGVAGVAAAWSLKQRGVAPLVISQGIGASQMTSGALDLSPWTANERQPLTERAASFLKELGIIQQGALVASSEGVIRPTGAVGSRLLSLDALAGRRIGIPAWRRADFRPEALAGQLASSSWARDSNTKFEVVELSGVMTAEELQFPLAGFCRLFDQEERLERLRSSIEAMSERPGALLFGPWLGEGRTSLEMAGTPIGETLSPPEGAFGRRLGRALDDFCAASGVEIRREKVVRVQRDERSLRVETESATGARGSTLWADAVILATGGLVGHGVSVAGSDDRPVELGPALGPLRQMVSGARDGWDPCADGGRWLSPPHWEAPKTGGEEPIVRIGDARGWATPTAPGGTLVGAIESGLDAAQVLS